MRAWSLPSTVGRKAARTRYGLSVDVRAVPGPCLSGRIKQLLNKWHSMAKAGKASVVGQVPSERAAATRQLLIDAATDSLIEDGFANANARPVAARAGCNQALIFYHFGLVTNLLLAVLDHVGERRLADYSAALAGATSRTELTAMVAAVFAEDLQAGYARVAAELIGASSSTPGSGPEVAARPEGWTEIAERAVRLAVSDLEPEQEPDQQPIFPVAELAYAVVAVYLGMEMLTHLDGDPTAANRVFDLLHQFAGMQSLLAGVAAFAGSSQPAIDPSNHHREPSNDHPAVGSPARVPPPVIGDQP